MGIERFLKRVGGLRWSAQGKGRPGVRCDVWTGAKGGGRNAWGGVGDESCGGRERRGPGWGVTVGEVGSNL